MNKNIIKSFTSILALTLLSMVCVRAFADITAKSKLKQLKHWWQVGSISAQSTTNVAETAKLIKVDAADQLENPENPVKPEDPEEIEESPQEKIVSENAAPGACKVARQPEVITCQPGGDFLCVNTPPGGVAADYFVITGIVDVAAAVGSLNISVQHDYSKAVSKVDTSAAKTSNCWNDELTTNSFCLDNEGKFAARVELAEKGPYSISVSASRASGSASQRIVSLSHVVPLEMTSNSISFTPNVEQNVIVNDSHVNVQINLLEECTFCDFIGASTGAVTITVNNIIKNKGKSDRTISCITTVEQGGQGSFFVGVPVLGGENTLKISACNAGNQASGRCPTIDGVSFNVEGVTEGLEILEPAAQPAYDADDFETINLAFKVATETAGQCVAMRFNRNAEEQVCPDTQGIYRADLEPNVGINVVTVLSGGVEYPWVFGWGDIKSPFKNGADLIKVPSALAIGVNANTATDVLQPLLTNFLQSDEFGELLSQSVSGVSGGSKDKRANASEEVEIAGCAAGKSELMFGLGSAPKIGKLRLENMKFGRDSLAFSINAKDVQVKLNLNRDKDGDGEGDLAPLPLKIGFRKLGVDLQLKLQENEDGEPTLILTGPHSDCDYKAKTYCKDIPVAVIPRNMSGSIGKRGHFVACDVAAASSKLKKPCKAMNRLNAQTGLMSEKVLDGINNAIHCTGSKTLTSLLRKGVPQQMLSAGSVNIPYSLAFADKFAITKDGLFMSADISMGDEKIFANIADELQHESVGFIDNPAVKPTKSVNKAYAKKWMLSAELATRFLNSALFILSQQEKSILNVDLHELTFKKLGFDFVKKCDEAEVADPLCQIRPRVAELFGSSLSTYGYLDSDHPLMISIRGNRALTPRLELATLDELPIVSVFDDEEENAVVPPTGSLFELQLAGLEISFYALQTEDGELVLDSEGKPIIHPLGNDDAGPENGRIISFELTALMAFEMGEIETDKKDASRFAVPITMLVDRSRLLLTPIHASNATTIPADNLVADLRQKIKTALGLFSGKPFHIPLPKGIKFAQDQNKDSLLAMLGLAEIDFGPNGISLQMHADKDIISFGLNAMISQVLHEDGEEFKEVYPQ